MTTAIVLAAGIASRLRPLADTIPKSLLTVGGRPLLQRNLEALQQHGITRCVLVTGYRSEQIERFVTAMDLSMKVEFVHNPVFDRTNNNYSLWLALPAISGAPMLLLDADILYDPALLKLLLDAPHNDCLIMRRSNSLGHEEIKCEVDARGAILRIGKHINPETAAGESVGIERFSAVTTARLYDILSRRRVYNEFYEASFQELIDSGTRIYAVDSGPHVCAEIDTLDDLAHAEELAQQIP